MHSDRSEKIHTINQLLKAYSLFEKDVEYIVQDGRVLIVDKHTGRVMHGRQFSDGMHQAIEAKEKVAIQRETQTVATITIQNYFRMYEKLSGMTGTAKTEAPEFMQIYKLDVVEIPTNKPISRSDHEDLIYKTKNEKYGAVINRVKELYDKSSIKFKLETYIENMPKTLCWCHLIICRSGAGTLAENLISGKPSIMIPLPISSDNHQMKNALMIEKIGAGQIINDIELNDQDVLISKLKSIIFNTEGLYMMSKSAKKNTTLDCCKELVILGKKVLNEKK